MEYILYCSSPLGKILLSSDGTALTGLWFLGQKYFAETIEKEIVEKEIPVFCAVKLWLDEYFAGGNPKITFPINLKGSRFRQNVWRHLLEIPYGETVTYGELAKRIAAEMGIKSMSAQAVGGAVGHNPISIIIPCHRVVGSKGNLTGYAGGIEKKEWLLRMEKAK